MSIGLRISIVFSKALAVTCTEWIIKKTKPHDFCFFLFWMNSALLAQRSCIVPQDGTRCPTILPKKQTKWKRNSVHGIYGIDIELSACHTYCVCRTLFFIPLVLRAELSFNVAGVFFRMHFLPQYTSDDFESPKVIWIHDQILISFSCHRDYDEDVWHFGEAKINII